MAETNGWLSIPDPFSAMLMAQAGFDSLTLDMQHGLFDERRVADVLMALGGATPRRLVRPPANDPAIVGKLLDLGADGLIVPMVNSAHEAQRLAEACHYPPKGRRSFGPVLSALRAGAAPYSAPAGSAEIFAMIETREALDAAGEIASVAGIGGLFVGPNDLALALGFGPGSDREEPEMHEALRRVAAAARKAGKRAGLFCASSAYAGRMAGEGFDFLTLVSDSAALARGAAAAVSAFKG